MGWIAKQNLMTGLSGNLRGSTQISLSSEWWLVSSDFYTAVTGLSYVKSLRVVKLLLMLDDVMLSGTRSVTASSMAVSAGSWVYHVIPSLLKMTECILPLSLLLPQWHTKSCDSFYKQPRPVPSFFLIFNFFFNWWLKLTFILITCHLSSH